MAHHWPLLLLAILSAMTAVAAGSADRAVVTKKGGRRIRRTLKGKNKASDDICLNDAALWRSCVGKQRKKSKGGKGSAIEAATASPKIKKTSTLYVKDVDFTLGANIEESLGDGCDCRMDVEHVVISYLSEIFDNRKQYNFLCAAISNSSSSGGITTEISTTLTFQVDNDFATEIEGNLSNCTIDHIVLCCLERSIPGMRLPTFTNSCSDLVSDSTFCQPSATGVGLQQQLNEKIQSCTGVGGTNPVFFDLSDIATLTPTVVVPTGPSPTPRVTDESTAGPTQTPSSNGPTQAPSSSEPAQVPSSSGPTFVPLSAVRPTTAVPTIPLRQTQTPTLVDEEEEEEPDPSVEIPIPTDDEGTLLFDITTFQVFVEPSFATIEFVNSSVFYAPEWAGIEFDAFGIQGLTPYGDTFFLMVQYDGIAKTVDCQIEFLGQMIDFVWGQEVAAEDDLRRWLQRKGKRTPAVPVDWHHELPRAVFANKNPAKGYNIPGIDRDFINRKDYGVLLRTRDHIRGIHHPTNGVKYNDQWTNWIENFKSNNGGRLPNRNQVLAQLDNFRQEYKPILDKGIRNHPYSYKEWGREKRNIRNSIRRQLEKRAKAGAEKLLTSKTRKAAKLIGKKAVKAIPIVGTVASVLFLVVEVAEGRPFWEAFIDNAQDAIPVWGTARGLYQIGGALISLFDDEIVLDENELEDMIWENLVALFGVGDGAGDDDSNDDGSGNKSSGGTSDPHFTGWNLRFSYQGACDLVFVDNDLVTVHVRTTFGSAQRRFSFISHVAIEIAQDVVEVLSNRTYFVNGVQPDEPPATVGGIYPFTATSSNFKLDLFGGQEVSVSFYRSTITLYISGHTSDFGKSVGLAGSFAEPRLLGRDGVSEFNTTSLDAFAEEWNVHGNHGDPVLFLKQPENTTCQPASRFTSSTNSVAEAVVECNSVLDEISRRNCIFDILASNETGWSENPAFSNPLTASPPQCQAKNNACERIGGNCVWRCNGDEFTCVPGNMCTASNSSMVTSDSECSCAIPITASPSISQSPTASPAPSLVPSSRPSLSGASLNQVITCISVIDESLDGPSALLLEQAWTQFRSEYPKRPFCLLQPEPNAPFELLIPSDFLEDDNVIFSGVTRDLGVAASASDWFDICDLGGLRSQGIVNVAVFIDNSGSLVTSNVQASFDLFVMRLSKEGMNLVDGIENDDEDWIAPFLQDFGIGE